ncbi:LysR family transcriptional regulator [Archangium primigenium]|uniref:LysR family transcriptional regulator n=1 Tax=[Archangium] primigenium TaxID=2792470 RepID=UPI0019595F84|nr:LysR family transcriptional regulator [Archangium primigenium]MBM7116823.1 LysR family transcriptional regulator [Archangium primigenium]
MDTFSEIAVFTRVVDLGGFARAAQKLRLTPSGVSRIVSRLESRLGVRLLNRTTRSLSLTDEGAAYYERCTRILADLDEANASLARSRVTPHGRLRVDAPVALADYVLGAALPRFLERYPEVSIDLTVRDQLIDPTAEGVDVVIRLAAARDSELVSRNLAPARFLLVASPAYLAARGRPRTLAALREHTCLAYLSNTGPLPWRLKGRAGEEKYVVDGRLVAGSGNVLTRAAVAGLGIAQTIEYHVAAELARGELEVVLEEYEPEPRTVHALFARQKSAVPKVRAFIDFLAELFASPPAGLAGRTRR